MTAPILAIDVTGPGGGAALAHAGRTRLGLIPPAVARGRDLVPQVRSLLESAALSLSDLGAIACAVGPGSFTGIRIGIATAATLAYAAEIPVLAIGSLQGIAAGAPDDAERVAVVLNARREHVYAARFVRRAGELAPVGSDRHLPAAEFAGELEEGTFVIGDGRVAYPALFARFGGSDASTVHPEAIARLGARAFAEGRAIRPPELRPLYLRLSDPEIRRSGP